MALSHITSLSTLQSPFHKLQFVGVSQNRGELIIPTEKNSRYHLVSLCHTARRNRRTISCVAGEVSSTPSTTISSIFVKGLADSVTEGRLKKVFSQFGQVSHVKIIVNERTRQSLGYGYVWFNKKEDAQLAVEAMNGKFFDGRFILVKFGQPGLSRRRRPNSDFLFVNK
ncbi:PREDICTED: uncharacterized RNA-binding protein C25G10.01 [Brassica oleracea var. oleracea]|uniref:RRM domain-containing protein n=1 Tax=Brassica oleracea var. oleracea TaxID=109376 RepID=A0A0D3B1W6_BRAOL|nr:PREDICTED: uncharacterized RNA-binding protein C25G10.01 [Brassica oleracea var. oleracea]